MSKKELNNLRQRISEIALNIEEKEDFTMYVKDYLKKTYSNHSHLYKNQWKEPYARR